MFRALGHFWLSVIETYMLGLDDDDRKNEEGSADGALQHTLIEFDQ